MCNIFSLTKVNKDGLWYNYFHFNASNSDAGYLICMQKDGGYINWFCIIQLPGSLYYNKILNHFTKSYYETFLFVDIQCLLAKS